MNKKVLITGANGLLGQKLVHLLIKKGYQILATSSGVCRISSIPNLNYRSLDITNEKDVKALISEFKPNVIINAAAMTNVDACEDEKESCWDINVNAVQYLTESSIEHNIHLIHVSTDFIFDGEKDTPYTEEDLPNPLGYYGKSKLASEQLILKSDLKKYSIARTTLVYGVCENMTRSNIVLWAREALKIQQPMNVIDDQFRAPTLADDLAIGCALLMEKEAFGIYNISGKEIMSIRELIGRIAKFYQYSEDCITTIDSSTLNQKAKRPPKTGFNLDKSFKIGYNPHSFEECLEILEKQLN